MRADAVPVNKVDGSFFRELKGVGVLSHWASALHDVMPTHVERLGVVQGSDRMFQMIAQFTLDDGTIAEFTTHPHALIDDCVADLIFASSKGDLDRPTLGVERPRNIALGDPLPRGFVVVSWHRKAPHWVVSYEDTHRRVDVVRSWARESWTEMHDDALRHIPGAPRGVLVYRSFEVTFTFDGPTRVAIIYP